MATEEQSNTLGIGRADHHDRRAARAERLHARADKAERERDSSAERARSMASIMNGQPVLVDHYSANRHRRDLERMGRDMSRACQADRESKQLRRRAQAAEHNASISSDDPDALAKLRAKLQSLESEREQIKADNRRARKGDKATLAMLAEACKHDACHDIRRGWPKYRLANLGGNIRRVAQRIADLEKQAQRSAREITVGDWHAVENGEDNRCQLRTRDGRKATPAERKQLKSNGFRWAPSVEAWQRQISEAAWYKATTLIKAFADDGGLK